MKTIRYLVLVPVLGGLLAAGAETLHLINVGTAPNDGTGDSLRTAFVKVNSNFVTLAARPVADLSGFYTRAEVEGLLLGMSNAIVAAIGSGGALPSAETNAPALLTDGGFLLTTSDGYALQITP